MFKKIVSNLPFSPALIGQLSFYTKRLKKEEITRRLGLVFVTLTVIIQSFIIFQPSEPASAISQKNSKDQSNSVILKKSVNAINISQGFTEASKTTASAGDKISYTISISNTNALSEIIKIEDDLSDILEYATLIDNGGGILNTDTNSLYWPNIDLKPNDPQTRTFIVKLLDPIPTTARNKDNKNSFDCNITNQFGNSINININCPGPKLIEQVSGQLPITSLTENITFIIMILFIAIYFYMRTRQLKKELQIIRRDAIAGVI